MENLSNEEQQRFEGSGKTMKIVIIRSIKQIDEDQIVELFKLVWTNQSAET